MLIRLGYDMQFDAPSEVPIVTLLNVHPSRKKDLREPDYLRTDPVVNIENYHDTFGNDCCRLVAPPGKIRFYNSTLIEDSGKPDLEGFDAPENHVEHLPHEQPLLRSRSVVQHRRRTIRPSTQRVATCARNLHLGTR